MPKKTFSMMSVRKEATLDGVSLRNMLVRVLVTTVFEILCENPNQPKSKIHTRAQLRVPKSPNFTTFRLKRFTRQQNKTTTPKVKLKHFQLSFPKQDEPKVRCMPTFLLLDMLFSLLSLQSQPPSVKKLSNKFLKTSCKTVKASTLSFSPSNYTK